MFLFKLNSPTGPLIVKRNVGTIDYKKGEIKLNPIKILSTSINKDIPTIEVSAVPYSNDVIGLQDLYLQLDISNTTVDMVPDQITSGDDVSGSNYIVSSSYSNGSLVRGPVMVNTVDTTTSTTTTTSVTSTSISSNTVTTRTNSGSSRSY